MTQTPAWANAAAAVRRPRPNWRITVAALATTILLALSAVLALGGRVHWKAQWFADGVFPAEDILDGSPSSGDKLLGGLLTGEFDDRSCLSRYRYGLLRGLAGEPSPYLLLRLRQQEALQRRCGPGTDLYRRAAASLASGGNASTGAEDQDCKYLVSVSYRGLGNRMLAAAGAFVYAVLTNRTLLIDRGDVDALFCEPFAGTSWLVPGDFPLNNNNFWDFNGDTPQSYGNLLKSGAVTTKLLGRGLSWSGQASPFVFANLDGSYQFDDRRFFCDEAQRFLHDVQWLVFRTDCYIVPGLFLTPTFEHELHRLFPDRTVVFHLLARYLLHPSNAVWSLITKYYDTNLYKYDERLGIQIRDFDEHGEGPFQSMLDQVLSCVVKEGLLSAATAAAAAGESKAVLVSSLSSWYYEQIKRAYALVGGIGFYQPSSEKTQQSEQARHNVVALSDIYLLSLSDRLVTSALSTFGYVAQGVGGLRPWILVRSEDHRTVPEPACRRAMSLEPCDHTPPFYDCAANATYDTGNVRPYIRRCEDAYWGAKIVA